MNKETSYDSSATLLLVDDDPAFLRVMTRSISRRGFAVWPAHDLAAAKRALAGVTPDLAVIDLHIGNESGLDLLEELARTSPKTVSVILSGYLDIPSTVAAVKRGAIDCLAKPVDAAQLEACLLAGRRRERALPAQILAPSKAKTQHILAHWEKNDRNTTKAAEVLGMHRRSLQRILIRAGVGRDRKTFEEKPSRWVKLRRLYSVWSGAALSKKQVADTMEMDT